MKEKLLHGITPLALAGLFLLGAGAYFFFFTRVDGYGRVIGLTVAATGLVALAVKFALLLMLKRRMALIWIVELMLIAALFVYARENGLP
ncbi:MAG TPA: hypothetical protein VFR39_04625 [Burkholderiales bacterium]|nr:hypothetical protein [Burkholderiales bacterium]